MLYPVAMALATMVAVLPAAPAATDDEDPRPAAAPPPSPAHLELPKGEPDATRAPPRHTAIYYVTGLGAPTGFEGFEGVRRVGSNFEISAGIGRGLAAVSSQKKPSLSHDLQWAVMPRLRLGGENQAFTIGAGISGGNYGDGGEWFCDGPCPVRDYPTSYVLWANLEVAIEHWWDNGVALRTFVGYARGCSATSCASASGGILSIPYLGIGLGYAF